MHGKLSKPEQFDDLVIRYEKRRSGCAFARWAARSWGWKRSARWRGSTGVPRSGLGIVKQSEANTVEVADRVKAEVAAILPLLPPGVSVEVAYDSSTFVKQAIAEVQHTVYIAFGLVLLIIFAFLRNFRSTIIPMLAVPVSLVGTFLVLSLLGYSINILTLLALVLAVGWWWTMPSWCWRTSSGTSKPACRRWRRPSGV